MLGAGKGIGRAIAKMLVECGAETVAVSRTKEDLQSLQTEVPGIQVVHLDLSNWTETRKVLETLGTFDLLVNNAGVARLAPFLELKEEDIDYTFGVNYKAVFNVSQVIAKGMVAKGQGGVIVNISSTASHIAIQEHATYSSSKSALDMLSKVMALELGKHKIRVNCVNPTVVMTNMGKIGWSDPAKAGPVLARIPFGKFVEVEDVVHAVMYLLSDKAAMINGVTLPVDGGLLTN